MILCIDVGNTHTVMGLFAEGRLRRDWRVSTAMHATADELRVSVTALLAGDGFAWRDVEAVVVGSVVPGLTVAFTELAEEAAGLTPLVVDAAIAAPYLRFAHEDPSEIGADRIANAIAAIDALGAPVIVVDLGTATTLDVIGSDGTYLGGAIAPGVETSADALFDRAARLSRVDLTPPERVVGRNTREAVRSGLLLGEAAMVDGLVRRVWEEIGTETPVVATGGLAVSMSPLCETVSSVHPDLTLVGLLSLYERIAAR